jgi:hypothetical protein
MVADEDPGEESCRHKRAPGGARAHCRRQRDETIEVHSGPFFAMNDPGQPASGEEAQRAAT